MTSPLTPPLEWNGVLDRAIRGGTWDEQGVATYRLLVSAIEEGSYAQARDLAEYFVVEAGVCYKIYRQWSTDIAEFLVQSGVDRASLGSLQQKLSEQLKHPDGRSFDPHAQWARVQGSLARLCQALDAANEERSLLALDELVEDWRQCHDRDVDFIAGLMNEVVVRFGEPALGPMYDAILVPWFNERYSLFDTDKHDWATAMTLNLQVAFEAMRGHLCGPGRRGDVEFVESADRYVLSFDPCGSGGRQVRGDAIEGTPPRHEAPLNWALTQEPAVWNHFEPGVCNYCAHCILLTEVMPMRAFGYPVRAVDPPRPVPAGEPAQKCSWTVFKDPSAVPDEYYERVAMSRPAGIGSSACGGDPTRGA